ncbi:Myeloid-associated differentiation marker-like protein 2 [Varanus komodoensis]|uniref:myeloid-associated differentiation marker-like protein 2 n=1 Tax=Varanus komodoensis TaxID=61221 RepID=UPI001CF7B64A|nr:myeloid-associated differentiation marker-like protein 2 [Varanus komodoensis]KAF7247498.1 Myeloid-associated differentiation marker-like protein 2 [Varanus komodoensis]
MESSRGTYLNTAAVTSRVGVARLLQAAFGCTTFSLVAHRGGFSAAYGTFCMSVWCFCFAVTLFIITCEVTHLHSCLSISWGNFTAAFAMLATLMSVTAAVIYPLYVQFGCTSSGCEVRDFRIAASVFAGLLFFAYAAEVFLSRAKPGQVSSYMATASGLLKIVQAFVACIIFGALVNGSQYQRHAATQWCVAVYSFCFAVTVVVVALSITGRTSTLRCPLERFVVIYTFVAVLMYTSAAVIWPVFFFDRKYGSPHRPHQCSRASCPWDSQMVVAVFTCVNLVLYIADLVYSQRVRFVSHP